MSSNDFEISDDMSLRLYDPPTVTLEIRVGEKNWHRNAACLTVQEAKRLREFIDAFIKTQEKV